MNKETNELLKEFVKERDWDRFHTPENLASNGLAILRKNTSKKSWQTCLFTALY